MSNSHPRLPGHRLAGMALIAAPLLGLLASQVWPDTPMDAEGRLAAIAQDSAAFLAANLLTIALIALFVPAVLGLVDLLLPYRTKTAAAGGVLAMLGLIGWTGMTAVGLAELDIATTADPHTAVAVSEAIAAGVGPNIFLAMFLFGLFIGLIVLGIGLWRARLVPGWVPAAISISVVLDFFASPNRIAVAVVWVLLALGLGWIGLRLLGRAGRKVTQVAMPAAESHPPVAHVDG